MFPRNNATPERILIGQVVLIADGTVQSAGVAITVRPQGGAEAAGTNSAVFGADNSVYYTPTQAETNYTSFTVIASKAACFSAGQTIVTTASATAGAVKLSPETHTSAVVPTVTNLTNLPAIPAGWLTAAGIAASALNGKGNWNIGKTGYALTAAGILAIWHQLTSTIVTVGTIGKLLKDNITGNVFARLGAPAGASTAVDIAAIKTQLDHPTNGLTNIRILSNISSDEIPGISATVIANGSYLFNMAELNLRSSTKAGTLTPTLVSTNLTGYTADQLIGRTLTYTQGVCDGESRIITSFAATNSVIGYKATTLTPGVTDSFTITPSADADVTLHATQTGWALKLATSANTMRICSVDTVTNAHTPTTTVFQTDSITEATGNHFNGRRILFTSGVLLDQATSISGYALVGGIGQFTVVAMTEAPADNDTFIIV